MISMGQPLLPAADRIMPYLRQIDENRWYSNFGPLVKQYEERLEKIFGCPVVSCSSATMGLMAVLMNTCLGHQISMPSWSFVATANAAMSAGLKPLFLDVDENTWVAKDAGLLVYPFGIPATRPGENQPACIDAAGAFDAVFNHVAAGNPINVPTVISTHATKVFSTGEGGFILCPSQNLADACREYINQGFSADRGVKTGGVNGKLSEYAAAVGLASLDAWGETRSLWHAAKQRYAKAFDWLWGTTPVHDLQWVGSIFCVRLPCAADPVIKKLEEKGIASRKVYGNGIHKYDAYLDRPRVSLPVTERLADTVLFLPYQIDMLGPIIDYMACSLKNILKEAV